MATETAHRCAAMWLGTGALLTANCAPAPSAHDAPSPSSSPQTATTITMSSTVGPASPAPAAATTTATARTTAAAARPPLPSFAVIDLVHAVPDAVHSLAIETQRGKGAALGVDPWLLDGGTWKRLPLPDQLRAKPGERDEARIFFGRDYLPRIMGARIDATGSRQLYLRYRHGSWRAEQREQAAFAGKPHAALYGVLGWDDPEVLCKVGAFCLIKQRSGWSQVPLPVPAPGRALRVDLGADGAYALLDQQLLRLGKSSWAPVGGQRAPWSGKPGGAWQRGSTAWVSAPEQDALYHFDGASWQKQPSPVRRPRGLWSSAPDELWVAGQDGAAYYDGKGWMRVVGIEGPVAEVIGRDAEVWFGGDSGVWTCRRPAAK